MTLVVGKSHIKASERTRLRIGRPPYRIGMPLPHHRSIVAAALLSSCLASTSLLPRAAQTVSAAAHAPVVRVRAVSANTAAQSNAPLTFGQLFAPGDVPSGQSVSAAIGGSDIPLQVDAKARHADGSLRHAVLTALVPNLPANSEQTLDLRAAPPATAAAPVTAASVLATPFDAVVTATVSGTPYRASARELLQASSATTWLNGPLASEWVLTAPLKTSAGVAHPHLTARFNVRAYQGAARVRVDTTVENMWAYQPNPSNITYTLNLRVGDNVVLNKPDLVHYHHARWRDISWFGADPRARIVHDGRYIVNTGAMPHYDPALSISEAGLAELARDWTGPQTELMGHGAIEAYMPTTGGRYEIGPLPAFAVMYLLSGDARAMTTTLGTGTRAGSWPIHYRDRDTDLPVSIDRYRYMGIFGNPGDKIDPATGKSDEFPKCAPCDTPTDPDSSHQPSLAYVPYALTGDFFYLEELQFWANYNLLQHHPYYREFEKGLFKPDQVRGQAWSLRELGYVAYITPDAHPLKAYFTQKLNNNIAWYTAEYPNKTSANPLGFIANGYAIGYENGRGVAPWQDDFFTWTIGHLVDMGFASAAPLMRWKSKFVTGRMSAPGTCWIFGATYFLLVRDSETAPFYNSFAQAYQATAQADAKDLPCAGQTMASALNLAVGEMVGYSYSPIGYPSNMQPALAIAAQSGIPDAQRAWDTFVARAVKPDYSSQPQFAIVPRTSVRQVGPTLTPGGPSATTLPLTKRTHLPVLMREFTPPRIPTATPTRAAGPTATPQQPAASPTPRPLGTPVPTPSGGFQKNPALTAIGANTALDLGRYVCPEPVGDPVPSCGTITDYSGFAYDSTRHQMLMFGGGHAASFRDDVSVFSTAALTWTSAYTATPCTDMTIANMDTATGSWKTTGIPFSRHTYDMQVYVPSVQRYMLFIGPFGRGGCSPIGPNGEDLFFGPLTVSEYDPTARTWTLSATKRDWNALGAAEYDPASGKVILFSNYGLWSYDPVSKDAIQHQQQYTMPLGYAENLVLYPPNGKMYYIRSSSPTTTTVYEITLDRANLANSTVREVTGISGDAPVGIGESGWAYDTVNQVIGGGVKDGVFYAFDPVAKTWTAKTIQRSPASAPAIGTQAFHALAFDPVNGVFIFITDSASGRRTWAYRYGP
jgi:hypothetical protein